MAYQVTLTLVGGERMRSTDVYREPTPNIGDKITVIVGKGTTRAQVTGIRTYRSRAPGIWWCLSLKFGGRSNFSAARKTQPRGLRHLR